MISEESLNEAKRRWEDNRYSKSGRPRGLILEEWVGEIGADWWVGQSAWRVMQEKNVPESFEVLVIDEICAELLENDGAYTTSSDGKFVPSEAQRLLAATTLAVRMSVPILVTTPGKLNLLKKINTSSIDVARLDVGALLAGEELVYLLQSYCESIDDAISPKSAFGAIYMTPIERRLAGLMNKNGVKFRAQVPVGKYFADFVIGEKLIVECDGEAWHDPEKDQSRDTDLAALGFQTLRVSGRAIFSDPSGSIERIRNASLGQSQIEAFDPIDLTPAQRKASTHWNGPVLVVAPAGSGKTRVVAERIKYLTSRGELPRRICAISFTNAAVGEIADRIQGLDDVETTTLHSLANRISKDVYGDRTLIQDVKTPNVPTRSDVISRVLAKMNLSQGRFHQSRAMLDAIGHYRNSLVIPNLDDTVLAEISEINDEARNAKFIEVHTKYEELLRDMNAVDFDGFVLDAIRVLQRDWEARMSWSRKFDYWMVDEFQDLAPPKMMLLRLLVSPARNLMAVGDDDQIIYGFAGSRPEIFSILNRDWRDMSPLPLDMNFRCPHDLVIRSQWLIGNNRIRIPKTITPSRELTIGDNVSVKSPEGYATTALAVVAEEIKNGRIPSDIALLFRVSMAAAPIELLFKQNGIKFVPLVKNSLIYNPTIKWLRSWLRVVNQIGVADDWRIVLHRPTRYLSVDTVAWILKTDENGRINPDNQIQLGIEKPELVSRKNETQSDEMIADALKQFLVALEDARAVGNSPSRQLRMLMLDKCLSKEEDEKLKRNSGSTVTTRNTEMAGSSVDPIVAYKIFYSLAEASEDAKHLEDWLNRAESDPDISLYEEDSSRDSNDRVILSTIHGFKGKEKPVVLVLGPEGAMPDRRSNTEEELEEERRIAYVSVTRAREKLVFAASSQYGNELSQDSRGITWRQYRDGFPEGQEKIVNDGKLPPGVKASTEKMPGTLDRILTWFFKFFE